MAGDAGEDDEGCRHGTAVNANQYVAVVEFHHQVGGYSKAGELQPPLLREQSAQEPDDDAVEGNGRKREAALSHLVLKSLDHFLQVGANVATEILVCKLNLLGLLKGLL